MAEVVDQAGSETVDLEHGGQTEAVPFVTVHRVWKFKSHVIVLVILD